MSHKKDDDSFSLMSLHQEIGKEWERKTKEFLEILGYDVQWYANNWNSSFDLLVDGKPVEVKAAYPSKRDNWNGVVSDRWQFNLTSKDGIDDHWFLILVAIDKTGLQTWFFIPGHKVTTRTISITSHPMVYDGKYAKFRSNTDYLDTFLNS